MKKRTTHRKSGTNVLIGRWKMHDLHKVIFCIIFSLALLPVMVNAQNNDGGKIKVSGIVKDDLGDILPGVTVTVKGTVVGTFTDAEGRYSFDVPTDAIIVYSYVGLVTTEEPLRGRTEINITMSSDQNLMDEVVVVGYGTQKKVSVVGSISNIAPAEIKRTATTSLPNALSGRMPGIITRQTSGEPGFDAANIYIRGMATWGAKNPLVLVDGIERSIGTVNPDEVESLSVLKDASATAVYGVKGANGVILITTKRGKQGKPQVSFRTEMAILTSLSQRNYIDGYQYASLMNEGLANVGKPARWTSEELEKFRTGSDPYLYPNVDWIDEVLKPNSFQTINNLSVTGGSEIVRYYVNLGYSNQTGIYRTNPANEHNTNAGVARYNYRSNVDINLSRDLIVELGVGGIIDDRTYPGAGAAGIFDGLRDTGPIIFPKTNPDGSIAGIPTYIGSNPWGQSTETGYSDERLTTIQSTAGLTWDLSRLITKGLSVKGHFSFDYYHANKALRYKTFGIKQYLGKDESGEDQYNIVREAQAMGFNNATRNTNQSVYWDVSANYQRTFNKMHTVSGMLLFNRRQYDDLSAGTSLLNLPYRSQGLAMRATYDYGLKYFVEFNAGYNGSENFPKGKQMGFFPAISVGWLVSGESFWNDKVVSNLKLRFSHGEVGNDQIGGDRFLYLTKLDGGSDQRAYFGESQVLWPGIIETKIGYNDVTWETAVKTNAGFDLGLWKDRISLQTDFFHERRKGILMQRSSVPTGAGFISASSLWGNLGEAKNSGFDAQLEFKDRTSSGFFYSLRGNITYAHNEVIENDKAKPLWDNLSEIGHSIGQPFGLVAEGFFQSEEDIDNWYDQTLLGGRPIPGDVKYKDVNGDGIIDSNDQTAIGYTRDPELVFGFGGTIEYKGFDFSVFFTGSARTSLWFEGRTFYPFEMGMGFFNVFNEVYDNRWTPETAASAKYPVVTDGNNPQSMRRSTVWQKDASFIRLKNMEIGYTLPKKVMSKLKMKNIRVFANGTNLITWDKINNTIDPESDNWYPIQRAINFGLSVDF